MKTISSEEFKKQYGETGFSQFEEPEKKPGYFKRIGQSIKNIATGLVGDLEGQAQTIAEQELEKPSLKTAGKSALAVARGGLRTAGAVAQGITTPITELPGVKQGSEFVGKKLAGTSPVKKFNEWSQKHPEAAKDIMNTLDIAGLFGAKVAAKPVAAGTKAVGKASANVVGELGEAAAKAPGALIKSSGNAPSEIMTRVARLNPVDEAKFTKVAGKSPGEYLVETGNFGSPQDIIQNEAKKFTQSKAMVDNELAKLPGVYRPGPVRDALIELQEKAATTSGKSVRSPYQGRVKELVAKYKVEGLTNAEINEVKRLYEREVKLGYNKMLNPDKVQRATNIDSAIRKWQVKKAAFLGFENIAEMNKQTQIARFLVNKLGDKVVGQQALNNVGLTDWIVLSGGSPEAVSGFLVKKIFSSKGVQAKIAKMLSGGEGKGLITPKKSLNPAYLDPSRTLPAGEILKRGANPEIVNRGVIRAGAPVSYESQATKGTLTRVNPKTGDRYVRDIKTGKLKYEPVK